MLSSILREHIKVISQLYSQITPGKHMTFKQNRSPDETRLLEEIKSTKESLQANVSSLARPRTIKVATGDPKGSWAHIYYISFHDPINSDGPKEGFYPVFFMTLDQRKCWLAVELAAASVSISGRGGWSIKRGKQLIERARLLGQNLIEKDGWRKGAITLGPQGNSLHLESGTSLPAARAYECGVIIAKSFDPHDPPYNLDEWLKTAFYFYDSILEAGSTYIEASVKHLPESEVYEQDNAAITGMRAEEYFMKWVLTAHPEWGKPNSQIHKVGLGFDIEFPQLGLKVEVKGCRGSLEAIRMTEHEWEVARAEGDLYVLAIICNLDIPGKENTILLRNPFQKLKNSASKQTRLQITYAIPPNCLQQHSYDLF